MDPEAPDEFFMKCWATETEAGKDCPHAVYVKDGDSSTLRGCVANLKAHMNLHFPTTEFVAKDNSSTSTVEQFVTAVLSSGQPSNEFVRPASLMKSLIESLGGKTCSK